MKTRLHLAAAFCALTASTLLAEGPTVASNPAPDTDATAPVLVSFTESNGAADNLITRGNSFAFKTSPVLVTDLGGNLPVRRVSARYKGPSGRFDFYVLEGDQKLSDTRDAAGVRRVSMTSVTTMINAAEPERRVPVASVRVGKTANFVDIRRFVGPIVGRYVIAIFHADNGRVARPDGKAIVRAANDGKAIVGGPYAPEDGLTTPGSDVPTIAEYNPGGYNPNLNPPADGSVPPGVPPVPGDPPSIFVPPPNISVPPPSGIPPISR